ncbi:MAG: VIT1/CCC1 transporter family protein [Anaerolineae bacterium]
MNETSKVSLSPEVREKLLTYQESEITEHYIYKKLAQSVDSPHDSRILEEIAEDELRHYHDWRQYTQQDVAPDRWRIWKYYLISRIFGFTFGIKLMERGEEGAQENYAELQDVIEEAATIAEEENEHEDALIAMLDEGLLRYTGSIVLGLNDALVELTGALAGLTLALQNTRLIALTGSITGIAAALSMGASEYLSTRAEEPTDGGSAEKHPVRASIYTGSAYIFTVILLILPYLLLDNYYLCLVCALAGATMIIAFFNYYVSVAKDEPFRERFLEMAGLSFGVAAFSFLIGFAIRQFLGIDV